MGRFLIDKNLEHKKFLLEAEEKHKDNFDYSKVKFKSWYKKVEIICKKHNYSFLQTPKSHVQSKYSCPKCSTGHLHKKDITWTDMHKRFIDKHGDDFDYSKSNYRNTNTDIEIICKKEGHGSFWQTPQNHCRSKNPCPVCRGKRQPQRRVYSTFKAHNSLSIIPERGYLYYFKDTRNSLYKIGITKNFYDRFRSSITKHIEIFTVIEFSSMQAAYEMEQYLHKLFDKFRTFNPYFKNNGGTEFFNRDVLELENVVITEEVINTILKKYEVPLYLRKDYDPFEDPVVIKALSNMYKGVRPYV